MSNAAPRPSRNRTVPTSARDLAMLRVAPISAAPLPRVHVAPRQAAGMLRVLDRSSGSEVLVYTPTFRSQFEAGHRAGRWYVRPESAEGGAPCSIAFATVREAVEAVGADTWRLRVLRPDGPSTGIRSASRPALRIIWTPESTQA